MDVDEEQQQELVEEEDTDMNDDDFEEDLDIKMGDIDNNNSLEEEEWQGCGTEELEEQEWEGCVSEEIQGDWETDDEDGNISSLKRTEELNICHEPIPAPESTSPFQNAQELEVFQIAMMDMKDDEQLPVGYGLLESEWEDHEGTYLPFHYIPARQRGREYWIDLPHNVWYPQAVLWCRALMIANLIVASRATLEYIQH